MVFTLSKEQIEEKLKTYNEIKHRLKDDFELQYVDLREIDSNKYYRG